MIKNERILKKFEDDFKRQEKMDLEEKYRILDAMYEEAVALGVFPPEDPLEGIDVKIKLARVMNSVP